MNELILNGSLLEISSNNTDDDIHAKFLICPLDELNSNGTGIKEEDIADYEKYGLKDKAIVTKVVKNAKGELDFSGHNMKVTTKVDGEGNPYKEYNFDTSAVGFHSDVYIEELEIGGEVKKCIVAEAVIWSRYNKVIEVIKRLGTNLKTSWEVGYSECYYDKKGGKWIKGLKWLGNCLLGSNVKAAYGVAGMLEFAEENEEMQLMLAATEDLVNLGEIPNINNKLKEGGTLMSENNKPEIASLSMEDIRNKVARAIYATEGDGRYYYGVIIYPLEFVAYAKMEGKDSKTEDYAKFSYVVNSDETISVTSQEDVKMVFVPKESYETEVSELKQKVSEKEVEISTKLDEIIKLGDTIKEKDEAIASKDTEIAELQPFKDKVEAAEAEAKKVEIEAAQMALKDKLISSKYYTKEEVEASEDLMKAIEELNEKAVKEALGAKVLEYASKENTTDNVGGTDGENIETSEANVGTSEKDATVSFGLNTNYGYKSKSDEKSSAIMQYIYS